MSENTYARVGTHQRVHTNRHSTSGALPQASPAYMKSVEDACGLEHRLSQMHNEHWFHCISGQYGFTFVCSLCSNVLCRYSHASSWQQHRCSPFLGFLHQARC